MQRVELGTSGIEVSRLALGTWNFAAENDWGPFPDREAARLVRTALDDGCNFFDTARAYGKGRSEQVLGKALKGRRDEAVIASKTLHRPARTVEREVNASLRALQTDRIDLYICHWPRPSLPLEPFFEALARLRDQGKIRGIGVSNFNVEQMRRVLPFGIVSLQPPFSLVWRAPDDLIALCRRRDIAITPYSPLAQGLLTGRFTRRSEPIAGVRKRNALFSEEHRERALATAREVDRVADELGATSSAVALAWLLQTPGIAGPIVGAHGVEQWRENARALELTIPDEDYRRLDEAGRRVWDEIGPDATMWGWRPE